MASEVRKFCRRCSQMDKLACCCCWVAAVGVRQWWPSLRHKEMPEERKVVRPTGARRLGLAWQSSGAQL